MGLPNPSQGTKPSGPNGDDREILFFRIQLTTSRIGKFSRLILTLGICDDHTYIYAIYFQVECGLLQLGGRLFMKHDLTTRSAIISFHV